MTDMNSNMDDGDVVSSFTLPAEIELSMDRFISASSSADAQAALQSIVDIMEGTSSVSGTPPPAATSKMVGIAIMQTMQEHQTQFLQQDGAGMDMDVDIDIDTMTIFLDHIIHFISTQQLKATSIPIPDEEEDSICLVLALNILQQMTCINDTTKQQALLFHKTIQEQEQKRRKTGTGTTTSSTVATTPRQSLLEALLDVMDRTDTLSTYIRVLTLQIIEALSTGGSSSGSGSSTQGRNSGHNVSLLSKKVSSIAQEQWLQAPNGLYRLADMVTHALDLERDNAQSTSTSSTSTSTNTTTEGSGSHDILEEPVRTLALKIAHHLAQQSMPIAKIFLFAELECQILNMIWKVYGGLTKGVPHVQEALEFVLCILTQTCPPTMTASTTTTTDESSSSSSSSSSSLQELVWQRPVVAQRLTQLIDLRGGDAFLHPEEYIGNKNAASTTITTKKSKKQTSKAKLGPLSRNRTIKGNNDDDDSDDEDDEDDLDSLLLQGATKKKTSTDKKSSSSSSSSTKDPTSETVSASSSSPSIVAGYPKLLESEEQVIRLVFQIIHVLLDASSEKVRTAVWTQYAPTLCTFVWELALLTPPPPGAPVVFCLPSSVSVQQAALELVATQLCSPQLFFQTLNGGLDRLVHVICTGGIGGDNGNKNGKSSTLSERLACSQAALLVLRNILTLEDIHTLLLHTLAPPPMELTEEPGTSPSAPSAAESQTPVAAPTLQPSVVAKLWNTVAEILVLPDSNNDNLQSVDLNENQIILVSGALGALTVFCRDAESRDMILRTTPTPSPATLEHMLEYLWHRASATNASAMNDNDEDNQVIQLQEEHSNMVLWAIYKFLVVFVYETPSIVQALLGNPASTHLTSLVSLSASKASNSTKPICLLLIGLCLEYFPIASAEEDCGGWTSSSLVELLKGIGIPQVTKQLQRLVQENKRSQKNISNDAQCELEAKHWKEWYQQAVRIVRRRIIRELAGSSTSENDADDEDEGMGDHVNDDSSPSISAQVKPLQKMIAQQATELEELQGKLVSANNQIANQESQLEIWQRRIRANPTDLDSMLSEMTTKTASLQEEIHRLQREAEQSKILEERKTMELQRKLDEERQESIQLKTTTQEAQEERDRMEQELSALSQAYGSLEEEYRRSSSVAATPSAIGSDEKSSLTPMSPGGSTLEVSTLRAENDRLRQDAQAADNWMSMAVQKMNEMGSQNGQLQEEIKSLKDELSSVNVANASREKAEAAVVEEEVEQKREETSNLQASLQSAIEAQQTMREENDRLKVEMSGLQSQIENVEQVYAAQQGLEELNIWLSEEKIALEQQLEAVQGEHSDAAAMQASKLVELEAILGEKETQIKKLKDSLENASQKASSITKTMDEETNQADTTQLETLDELRQRSQEEIYKKESIIRELENRLANLSSLGPYTVEDIRSRDGEIEELRIANDAAQDWMSKAVEHTQMLQEKNATLLDDISKMKQEVQDLKSKNSFENVSSSYDATEMHRRLEEATLQMEEMRSLLGTRDDELKSLREEFTTVRSSQDDIIEIAREDIHVLEKQLEESRAELADAQTKLAGPSEKASKNLTQLEAQVVELESKNSELESRLEEFQAWTDVAREKMSALLISKKESEDLASAKDAEITLLQSQLEEDRTKVHDLQLQNEDHRSVIDELEAELKTSQAKCIEVTNESNTVKGELTALQTEVGNLRVLKEEAEEQIHQMDIRKNVLENELASFKATISAEQNPDVIDAEDFFGTSSTSEKSTPLLNESSKDEIKKLEFDLEGAKEAKLEMENRVTELQSELESIQKEFKEKSNMYEASIKDLKDYLAKTESRYTEEKEDFEGEQSSESRPKLPSMNSNVDSTLASDAAAFFDGEASTNSIQTSSTPMLRSTVAAAPSTAELTAQLREIEDELQHAHTNTNGIEETSTESVLLKERIIMLEQNIEELENEAKEQGEEATHAITQWQNSLAESEQRCTELEAELAQLALAAKTNDNPSEIGDHSISPGTSADPSVDVQIKSVNNETRIEELEEHLRIAHLQIESDKDVLHQWTDKIEELENNIAVLSQELEDEGQAAEAAIEQWQDRYNEIEEKCLHLEEKQEESDAALKEANDATIQVRGALSAMEKRCEQLQADLDIATQKLRDEQNMLHDSNREVANDSGEIEQIGNKLEQVKKHVQEKQDIISKLEDELEELRTKNESLIRQLQEKEEISSEALLHWQDSCKQIQEKYDELKEKSQSETISKMADTFDKRAYQADLQKLQDQLQQKRDEIIAKEGTLSQWQEKAKQLEAQVSTVLAQLAESEKTSSSSISQLQLKYDELNSDFERVQEELSEAQAKNIVDNNTESLEKVIELEEKCTSLSVELETSLKDKELVEKKYEEAKSHHEESRDCSEKTIQSLQEKTSVLEDRCLHLQAVYETALEKKELSQREVDELSLKARYLEEKNSDIESKLMEMEHAKDSFNDSELAAKEKEIAALNHQLKSDEDIVRQWEKKAQELGGEVESLQNHLEEQEFGANEAIAQWQGRHAELQDALAQCESELESTLAKLTQRDSSIENLQGELSRYEDRLTRLVDISEKERLENELAVERGQHEETKEELEALKIQLNDLEEEMTQQGVDATNAILSWEARTNELQSQIETLEADVSTRENTITSTEKQLQNIQKKYDDLSKEQDALTTKSKSDIEALMSECDQLKEIAQSKSTEKLEEERDRLKIVITRMDEELNMVNSLLQSHLTDEFANQAAAAAAQSLREEIGQLKKDVAELEKELESERYHRESAEQEIVQLRDDIRALVSINEHENPTEEIQLRTSKAVERLKIKERIEIEQLRKAVYKSIEEVESARFAEKEASDKLAKIRLELAVSEQEVITAKSEINFLTQSLEELRMNEESKRASLEYRIGSLEDENDMLRRYHSSELETVRNELAQVSMEKDRVLYQLKESEKTNSSLVLAASQVDNSVGQDISGDLNTEVAKLRIENAHLLTVAADDKARAERRLREVLAAHRATAEADTILEKELRLASEATIQSLKSQLEEIRATVRSSRHATSDDSISQYQDQAEKLEKELNALREELEQVKKDNESLKAKIEQVTSQAQAEITTMRDECEAAQAKVEKYERQDQFEAAVRSEVAKQRQSPHSSKGSYYDTYGERTRNSQEEKKNKDDDDYEGASRDDQLKSKMMHLLGTESFDLIQKQRDEMEEERKMYREFLTEHDDLLALLAQNDMEREQLKKALTKVAGSDVLDSVLKEAEAMALREYGNVIKVA